MSKKVMEYRREFFDREYTAKEAYARLWAYAKRYRLRIILGVICGVLTATTLLPMFQLIQPSLRKMENLNNDKARIEERVEDKVSGVGVKDKGAIEKKAEKLGKEYGKVKGFAKKFGIELQDEDEALGLPLLLAILIIIPVAALLRCGLVFLNHYCLAWAGMKTVKDIRCDILNHVIDQSMQFHGRIDVGQMMSRCTSDPQQVQLIMQNVLQELAQAPFEIAISVGFIVYSAIANNMLVMLGLIVIGFPMFMIPVVALSKRIRRWSRRALEEFSTVGGNMHEILTCIKVVKAYDCEEHESEKYEAANARTLKATLRSVRWGLLVGPLVETIGIFLLSIFIVWCFAAGVKLSAILPMLAPLLIIYRPLKQLSKLQVQIEQGRAALTRIWSIMDVEMKLEENKNAIPKNTFEDKIAFKDVSFRYDTAEHDAVVHASFEIGRGKMVAVVGGTGSGKTTLSGLLARFYDPKDGEVTIDGHSLKDVKMSDLRMLIGSVQQETLLFNDTIEANIQYGSPDATHEQIVEAAKMANAHDFIMSQPEGYERLCGEKGFALSGGERQRIAIARAILRNPPILILDEATSALDTVTERLVQDALNNLMKNRTVFAIAHRLSTIRNADLILVMQNGEIVERGNHNELYKKNGVYRKLCDIQENG